MPLMKPALTTVAILTFLGDWNDFFGPFIYLNRQDLFTAAVGLRFFVIPALRAMQGLPPEHYLTASVKESVGKKQGLRFFAKASANSDAEGQLQVEALPGQESFKISPLMNANCWLIADEATAEVAAGSLVKIAPLYPDSLFSK